MFIDFNTDQNIKDYSADLCIIGCGAAGITLAKELGGTRASVLILESGGFQFAQDTQDLYRGENDGLNYFPLEQARLRMFGGSTNHWEGYCTPFDELDFEPRDWVAHSGWPITRKQLVPYYERAQTLLGLSQFIYDESLWPFLHTPPLPFNPKAILHKFWQASPSPARCMGFALRACLEQEDNVRILLHANVVNINASATASRIESVHIRNLAGSHATIRARQFILACGGIENSRLLLSANDIKPAGIGNEYDQVGRYFMEHPHTYTAFIAGNSDELQAQTSLFDEMGQHGKLQNTTIFPGLCISPELQRDARILNCSHTLQKMRDPASAVVSVKQMIAAAKERRIPDDAALKLWNVIANLDDLAAYVTEKKTGKIADEQKVYAVYARSEQEPNPDSRITLGSSKDALGMPRAKLHWALTDLDRKTLMVASRTIGAELARLAQGRMKLLPWLAEGDGWSADLEGGNHHMGGTRMSTSPLNGVVDANCRIHSMDNFHIAGSSVFSTASYANPTLTLVALAIRLADHLKTNIL